MITTAEAAERLGINVAKFHRLVAKHHIHPAFKLSGIRGAMLWDPHVIEALRKDISS
jgi:excisionase family DNA binding protein